MTICSPILALKGEMYEEQCFVFVRIFNRYTPTYLSKDEENIAGIWSGIWSDI